MDTSKIIADLKQEEVALEASQRRIEVLRKKLELSINEDANFIAQSSTLAPQFAEVYLKAIKLLKKYTDRKCCDENGYGRYPEDVEQFLEETECDQPKP